VTTPPEDAATTTTPPDRDRVAEQPYGSWESPIGVDALTADTVRLGQVAIDGTRDLYWLEGRPAEGGRTVLVRLARGGEQVDVTPAPYDVRSRVHEYGGGAAAVADGLVVFSHVDDNRVYRLSPTDGSPADPVPIAPGGDLRYGDLRIDRRHRWVLCVREDHRGPGECVNTLACLDLDGPNDDGGTVLVEGFDFVSSPELSPSGDRLAWIAWNHPNMPWDATTLYVATIDPNRRLGPAHAIAGGAAESIFQPRWLTDDRLVYCSDRTGWGNLYAQSLDADGRPSGPPAPLHPAEKEFAAPAWSLGASTYDVIDPQRLAVSWTADGVAGLGVLDLADGRLVEVSPPPAQVGDVRASSELVACLAGWPDVPPGVASLPVPAIAAPAATEGEQTRPALAVVRSASRVRLPAGGISVAQPIAWPSVDGDTAHGYFYPPASLTAAAPTGQRPPLLVLSHGGPTGATSPAMSLNVQFWTSRGFAVLDVDYGGSTGYGRAYRDRLAGRWGIVDVADCCSGARFVAEQGWADPARMAIRGGSAGGYTTLCALTFTDVFAAGASRYGIGDLAALARDTHKFESRYLDGLVGPYPQAEQVYRDRSPIYHVDRLDCALVLLQGTEDKVVPPAQAQQMADAVRAKGKPVALLMLAGEGHGFRREASIRAAIEAELYFFGRVFGFTPAGLDPAAPPIEVENLPA